jgi:hypothetical protein
VTDATATAPKSAGEKPGWVEHIGILLTASLFVIISLRILGAADWDATVALAIVQSGGVADVALASALSSAPTLVSLALVVWAALFCAAILERRVDYWSWTPALYGALLVLFLVPTAYLIAVAVLIAISFAVRSPLERRRGQQGQGVQNPYTPAERRAWLISVLGGQIMIASMTAWLPSESVSINGGDAFAGYVVSDDTDMVTVLRDEGSPKIERVDAESVERSYCDVSTSWPWKPLAGLGKSTLDECPD